MKRVFLCAGLFLAPAAAQAQLVLPAPYVEIAGGESFLPIVHVDRFVVANLGRSARNASLYYGDALTGSAEIGYAGILVPNLRFGIAYDYLEGKFEHGTLTESFFGFPLTVHFTRSEAEQYGVELDRQAQTLSGNLYYGVTLFQFLRPYVGFGVGPVFVRHEATSFSEIGTAGVQAAVTDTLYLGVRYRYNSVTDHSVMALLGWYVE